MPYVPPARIKDFDRSANRVKLYDIWHQRIAKEIQKYTNRPRFLDPLKVDENAVRATISWHGFPRIFDSWLSAEKDPGQRDRAHRSAEMLARTTYVKFGDQFFQIPADPIGGLALYPIIDGRRSNKDVFTVIERPQDEYLEWHVVRDPATQRVTRIDFTVEAPEYWEVLAEGDNDLAAKIYSELLGVNVPADDLFFKGDIVCPRLEKTAEGSFRIVDYVRLFPDEEDYRKGQYNPWNRWNTELGAVHLTQRNNTLFAEINLAAGATRRFAARADLASGANRFELIACGGYGAINRNSDPTIGFEVNSLVLDNKCAMVSDPIGLYIGEIDLGAFRDPDGKPVAREKILTLPKTGGETRGSFDDEDGLARVLRFSVHPPEGAAYGLERCTFDGHPLTTGGPIARKTSVVIHGIAMPENRVNPVVNCLARACAHPTKLPAYFLTVSPQDGCPAPDDEAWKEAPVDLAPEVLAPAPQELLAGLAAGRSRKIMDRRS